MIRVSVWKLCLVMPTPRPSSGPAIQCAQPPLRPGTYSEGTVAAPAAKRKVLVTTPSSPDAPKIRRARTLRRPAAVALPPDALSAIRMPGTGVAACMGSFLRLGERQAFGTPGKLL
jgi:hypothetical protein